MDFVSPEFEVKRVDSYEIRQKILSISYIDWKKLGFSKGTLHYMKQNAKSDKPFTLNSHVLERIEAWEKPLKENKEKVLFFVSSELIFPTHIKHRRTKI